MQLYPGHVTKNQPICNSANYIFPDRLNLDVWDSEEQIPRDEFLKRVKNIDGLYCLITERVDGELLDVAG